MPKLDRAQIGAAMKALPAWRRTGARIARTYEFKDFPVAIRFVNTVARVAEKAWHHPDIDIRWNQVTLTLTTHDAGGLTEKDFELAGKFDRLLKPWTPSRPCHPRRNRPGTRPWRSGVSSSAS